MGVGVGGGTGSAVLESPAEPTSRFFRVRPVSPQERIFPGCVLPLCQDLSQSSEATCAQRMLPLRLAMLVPSYVLSSSG